MSRSVFEEVGDAKRSSGEPPRSGEAARATDRRRVRIWILIMAILVVIQIAVGGLTRITDSGLSITEWDLVMGVVPPLSDEDWRAAFAAYQQTTEFRIQNSAMTLEEFKPIFWWEWGHRLWGRILGVAFVVPFAWFLYKRAIPSGWLLPIAVAGGLGALQGFLGWWMVESGLFGDRTDVSPHRLAIHKGVAYVILGLLFWIAFSLKRQDVDLLQARRRRETGMLTASRILMAALGVQIVMGAYVAGLNGGGVYGEWPLMGGAFYPPGEPFQPFDNPAAAQFLHRIFAYLLVIGAAVYFWRARRSAFAKTRLFGAIILGVVGLQTVIGIGVLASGVHAHPAFVHHFLAIVLFVGALHATHQSAYPAEQRIAK